MMRLRRTRLLWKHIPQAEQNARMGVGTITGDQPPDLESLASGMFDESLGGDELEEHFLEAPAPRGGEGPRSSATTCLLLQPCSLPLSLLYPYLSLSCARSVHVLVL